MLNSFLEKFYRVGLKVIIRLIYRCEFKGFEKNMPKKGGAIVVSNHVSYMDGAVLTTASPRRMRFVIDEEIYRTPGVHYFMSMDRAIPISPNKDSVKRALRQISDGLEAGDLIMIFPEGQLTYTGYMIRFKLGIEWILKENKYPVIPVCLIGLWGSIFSRKYIGQKYWWVPKTFRRKVKAICGKKIPADQASVNRLQKEIMMLKSIHSEKV
jgi:1-acyl-sn-glycerol-3-phosphate acyltransferase